MYCTSHKNTVRSRDTKGKGSDIREVKEVGPFTLVVDMTAGFDPPRTKEKQRGG